MSKIKLRVDPRVRVEHVAIRLQEATVSSDWQMILPMGTFITRAYGKLDFTEEYLGELVENWKQKVLGERQPFIDSDHDWGKANGWITDLAVQKDGLYAKVDWTELGRTNIEGKLYRYFSADIGDAVDMETGDVVSPVLIGAALTNTPQMNMMPPAHLSESNARRHRRTRGDARSFLSEEEKMNKKLKELWAKLDDKELSEVDRAKVLATIKQLSLSDPVEEDDDDEPEDKEEKDAEDEPTEKDAEDESVEKDADVQMSVQRLRRDVKTVMDVNKTLATQLKELRTERAKEREDAVIAKALNEGKILPKDERTWRKRFHESPKLASDILKEMPEGTAVDLSERGTAGGGAEGEVQLTADDLTAARVARIAPEEYKKLKLSGKL